MTISKFFYAIAISSDCGSMADWTVELATCGAMGYVRAFLFCKKANVVASAGGDRYVI
jgi:hypothetical protein